MTVKDKSIGFFPGISNRKRIKPEYVDVNKFILFPNTLSEREKPPEGPDRAERKENTKKNLDLHRGNRTVEIARFLTELKEINTTEQSLRIVKRANNFGIRFENILHRGASPLEGLKGIRSADLRDGEESGRYREPSSDIHIITNDSANIMSTKSERPGAGPLNIEKCAIISQLSLKRDSEVITCCRLHDQKCSEDLQALFEKEAEGGEGYQPNVRNPAEIQQIKLREQLNRNCTPLAEFENAESRFPIQPRGKPDECLGDIENKFTRTGIPTGGEQGLSIRSIEPKDISRTLNDGKGPRCFSEETQKAIDMSLGKEKAHGETSLKVEEDRSDEKSRVSLSSSLDLLDIIIARLITNEERCRSSTAYENRNEAPIRDSNKELDHRDEITQK